MPAAAAAPAAPAPAVVLTASVVLERSCWSAVVALWQSLRCGLAAVIVLCDSMLGGLLLFPTAIGMLAIGTAMYLMVSDL